MTNIDFLPTRYKEQATKRQKHAWRGVVVLIFGGAVGLAALFQSALYTATQAQLEAIAPLHAAAMKKREQLTTLQAELRSAQQDAELYAYLHHPWPRTQIIAAITRPLPQEISLHAINFQRERLTDTVASQRPPRIRRLAQQETTELTPAAADLKSLRDQHDTQRVVVVMGGEAKNVASLHAYVEELSRFPLVTNAEIRSFDADGAAMPTGTATVQFTVRMTIKPGYGQPNGPSTASAKRPSATSANHVGQNRQTQEVSDVAG